MVARRPLVDVDGRVKQLPAGDRLDLPLATTAEPGLMPAADKSKLNGVQSGATANSPDATLLNRANHTGTQPASTITGLGSSASRPIQAGLFIRADDGNTAALAGAWGFGGQPQVFGDVPAADLLQNYGISKVMRTSGVASGMYAYSPILHLGGIDTWWQIQANYSSFGVRVAYGYADNRYGVVDLLSTAMKADVSHALAGVDFSLFMTAYTTKAAIDAATAKPISAPVVEIAASLTIATSHVGQFLWSTTSSALTITIPANSSVAFPVGAEIHIGAFTAGSLTLSAASGVTLDLPNSGSAVLGPNMNATLKKMQTNRWRLIGQTVAA